MQQQAVDQNKVLGEAVREALRALGIKMKDGQEIIGLSKTHFRNVLSQGIDPLSKTGELSLCFLRVYRSLYALLGGQQKAMHQWLHTPNKAFAGEIPVTHMKRIEGLLEVLHYCDAMRAKI